MNFAPPEARCAVTATLGTDCSLKHELFDTHLWSLTKPGFNISFGPADIFILDWPKMNKITK